MAALLNGPGRCRGTRPRRLRFPSGDGGQWGASEWTCGVGGKGGGVGWGLGGAGGGRGRWLHQHSPSPTTKDVSDAVAENAAQSWTHRCGPHQKYYYVSISGHTVGMRHTAEVGSGLVSLRATLWACDIQQKLGQVLSPCGPHCGHATYSRSWVRSSLLAGLTLLVQGGCI